MERQMYILLQKNAKPIEIGGFLRPPMLFHALKFAKNLSEAALVILCSNIVFRRLQNSPIQ